MDNYVNVKLENYLLKIVGVFPYQDDFAANALQSGYEWHKFTNESKAFYKDYFYKGFRDLYMEDVENQNNIIRLCLKPDKSIRLYFRDKEICIKVNKVDLFLFPESFGIFSIDIRIEINEEMPVLAQFSDACFLVREFDKCQVRDTNYTWNEYIVNEFLLGNNNRGDEIEIDEISGTKYKLFIVCDIKEKLDENIQNALLYDLGCVVLPGSALSNDLNAPSLEYKTHLEEKNYFSVFKNWRGAILSDTFVIVGNGILINENQKNTYQENYLYIYIHNLYVKYQLFKFNTMILDYRTDLRPDLRLFLNQFNLPFISYNFLPTLINTKLREVFNTDNEVDFLSKRIHEIGLMVEEKSQEKTNLFLAIVSLLASLSTIKDLYEFGGLIQGTLDLPRIYVYIIMILSVFLILSTILIVPKKILKIIKQST